MTSDAKTSWRLFCAIDLPEEAKASVAAHAAHLREAILQARASWERPEKLHLTVKFLGDVKVARVESLKLAAERASLSVAPFKLTIGGAGAFPPHGPARVLWLGVADTDGGLARLQNSLEDECAVAGFPREKRDFKPHLTVARLRAPSGARALADAHRAAHFEPQTFRVSELVVIRSEFGAEGSRHTALSRHDFRAE
jgi:2'-5' RNA ligase